MYTSKPLIGNMVLHVDFRSFSDDAPLTYDRMTG